MSRKNIPNEDIINRIYSYGQLKENFKQLYFKPEDPPGELVIYYKNTFYGVKSLGHNQFQVYKKFGTK